MKFQKKKPSVTSIKRKLPPDSCLPQSINQRNLRVDRLSLLVPLSLTSCSLHIPISDLNLFLLPINHILFGLREFPLYILPAWELLKETTSTTRHKFKTLPLFVLTSLVYTLSYIIPDPSKTILDFQFGKWIVCFLPQNVYLLFFFSCFGA